MDDWQTAWLKGVESTNRWLVGLGEVQRATWTAAARQVELMANTHARLWGRRVQDVLPADERFEDEAWQDNLAFDVLKQMYLITSQWTIDTAAGLTQASPELRKQATFWARQAADALSPTNFPLTNPTVLQEIVRTGGGSLVRGMQNWLRDLQKGEISMVPEDTFQVGRDLAVTPGKVVYRNEVMELIQYSPATESVHAVPILVFPAWINKYYVMDLTPANSLYRYLVDAGFCLFGISWKNPRPGDAMLAMDWDDLLAHGPLQALRVVKTITGTDKVNLVGYCLGGILLTVTLAYLAATGDTTPNTATLLATHQDFRQAGDIEVFIGEAEVRALEALMAASGGYLDSRNMAATFNLLRSNDLLWHFVIHNYLLGQEPPAFDLLYWNSDGTRVPARIHSFLLREFFMGNKLRLPDGIRVRGVGLDTRRVTVPTYAVAGDTDHIVPWRGAFQVRELLGGPVRFVLGESGHIAGIINPPARGKRAYWTNDDRTQEPDTWLADATRHPGSWWLDWVPWLADHSGDRVAPPAMGSGQFPAVATRCAPGQYVLEK